MRFVLLGDDRLSPALNHAAITAGRTAVRMDLAMSEADLAMANLARDGDGNLRSLSGRMLTTSEASQQLGYRALHMASDAQLAMAGMRQDADDQLRTVDGRLLTTAEAAQIMGDAVTSGATRTSGSLRLASGNATTSLGGMTLRMSTTGDAARILGDDITAGAGDGGAAIRRLGDDADAVLPPTAATMLRTGDAARTGLGDRVGDGSNRGRRGLLGMVGALRMLTLTSPGVLAVAGPVAKLLAMLGSAVPLVGALVGTLANVLPAAGLAATGILMVVSAKAALKLGMVGLGDAVKAAFDPGTKPEELAEALKKLAPNARSFVMQLQTMRPALHALQLDVQNRLFTGLDKAVAATGKATLPTFRRSLLDSAGALNLMGRGVLDNVRQLGTSGTFATALKGANAGLRNLSALPGVLVKGLVDVGAAAAPAFARLTAAGGSAISRLSTAIDKGFKSGGMQRAIEGAIDLIGQLATVGKNVGSIIGSIFHAASGTGGGTLGMLQSVTAEISKIMKTAGVQDGLRSLFQTMALIGRTAAPILGQALAAVAPVLVALGPPVQLLVGALGAGLTPIVKAAGPLLVTLASAAGLLVTSFSPLLPVIGQVAGILLTSMQPVIKNIGLLFDSFAPVVRDLAPVLVRVGTAAGSLIVAAAPMIPVFGQLALALLPALTPLLTSVVTIFTRMAPIVSQVANLIGSGGLQPVFDGLAAVVTELVTQGGAMFLDLLTQLTPVIPMLIPPTVQLAKSIGSILVAIAPLLPQITMLGVQLITNLLPAVLPLIPPAMQLSVLFLRLATVVITGAVIPALTKLVGFFGRMQKMMAPGVAAVTWVTTHIAHAFEWLYDHLVGHSVIPDMVRGIVGWLAGMPGKAARAIAGLPGSLARSATSAANSLIGGIRKGIDAAVWWVRGMPSRAVGALGDLGSKLYKSGQSLISGFASGIRSRISDAVSAAKGAVGAVRDYFPWSPARKGPFSGGGWTLYSGRSLMDGWTTGILSRTGAAAAAMARVTGAVAGALPDQLAMGGRAAAGVAAARSSGGGDINVYVNGALDPVAVGKQLQRILLELKRNNGGDLDLGGI